MHLPNAHLTRSILLLLSLFLTSDLLGPTTVTALQLGSRQSPAHALIARAQLHKRGNCCSQPDNPDPPPNYGAPYPSDPSVDDLKADITSLGTVAGKRSLFYTGLGGLGGQNQVEAWACLAIDRSGAGFVIFRTLFPDPYINQKLVNLASSAGKSLPLRSGPHFFIQKLTKAHPQHQSTYGARERHGHGPSWRKETPISPFPKAWMRLLTLRGRCTSTRRCNGIATSTISSALIPIPQRRRRYGRRGPILQIHRTRDRSIGAGLRYRNRGV